MPGNQTESPDHTPLVYENQSRYYDRRLCHRIMWIAALIRALDFYN